MSGSSSSNEKNHSRVLRNSSAAPDNKSNQSEQYAQVVKKPSTNSLKQELDALKAMTEEKINILEKEVRAKEQAMKETESNSEKVASEFKVLIDEWKQKYEMKKIKVKEQKNTINNLTLELEKKIEENDMIMKKVNEKTVKMEDLKQEMDKEKEKFMKVEKDLRSELQMKLREQEEEHKSLMEASVSVEEYNSLYDEYNVIKKNHDELQDIVQEQEDKLNKAIADKKVVEKKKLAVIRQKRRLQDDCYHLLARRDTRSYSSNRNAGQSYNRESSSEYSNHRNRHEYRSDSNRYSKGLPDKFDDLSKRFRRR